MRANAKRPEAEGNGDSLAVAGARGVVRLQPLAEREQARVVHGGGRLVGAEPAHGPAPGAGPRAQLAGPRRVALHRAPHQVAHLELPAPGLLRARLVRILRALGIYDRPSRLAAF